MYLLAIMHALQPVTKSKTLFVCTILNPAKVNLTTNTKNYRSTEYCVGHIKDVMNHIVTFTGALNNLWLLCLMYVVYILNITANSSIGDISPHHHSYGQTPNISPAFVSDSMSQSTTLVLILFMPLLRKRGDGLVLPLTSGIF